MTTGGVSVRLVTADDGGIEIIVDDELDRREIELEVAGAIAGLLKAVGEEKGADLRIKSVAFQEDEP